MTSTASSFSPVEFVSTYVQQHPCFQFSLNTLTFTNTKESVSLANPLGTNNTRSPQEIRQYAKLFNAPIREHLLTILDTPPYGSAANQLAILWSHQYLITLCVNTDFVAKLENAQQDAKQTLHAYSPKTPDPVHWRVTDKGDLQADHDPFDTLLVVTGDFGSLDIKKTFAAQLAKTLNQHLPPHSTTP